MSQPERLGDGTLNGDRRRERAARRNADTNKPVDADVSRNTVRTLHREVDREQAQVEALRKLAEQGVVKPTRAQRKAEKVAAATAAGAVGTPVKLPASLKPGKKAPKTKKQKTAKDRWKARKKFVHRIPKKMKITRAAVWVAVGGVASVTDTARTAAKAARAAKRAHGRRANETPATPRKRRTAGNPFGGRYQCCGTTYRSAEAMNAHFLAEHMSEDLPVLAGDGPALLAPGTTRATAGTVRVLPPVHGRKGRRRTPAGRHRPGHKRRKFKAEDYVNAHRDEITRIGDRMSTREAHNVQQALLAWGELKPKANQPWTLDELRGVLVGLERAFVVGAEALDTMERTLNRPGGEQRGCNIDMSVTRPGMRRAREGMAETARGLTQVIADFEITYWPFLRGLLAAPAVAPNRR